MFMIRQASYSYGMHGISLWVLSMNVNRFRPLLKLNGIAYLLAGPVFFAIDYSSGMPTWWTIGDSLGCGLMGAALLILLQRDEAGANARNPPETFEIEENQR